MEPSPSEAGWIRQIEGLIEEGQCFLAYDRSGQARRDYPDSRHLRLLAILALMRSGGVLEARKILCEMPDALEALEPIASQILDALRQHLPPLLKEAPDPQGEPLDWLLAVATQLKQLGERTPDGTREDLGTLDLCARIHAELWRHQGSPRISAKAAMLIYGPSRLIARPVTGCMRPACPGCWARRNWRGPWRARCSPPPRTRGRGSTRKTGFSPSLIRPNALC